MIRNSISIKMMLVVLFSIVAVVYLGLYVRNQLTFRVTDVVPAKSNTIPSSTSVIKITFSKKLDETITYNRDIVNDPDSIVKEVSANDNQLFIRLFHLKQGAQYRFHLKDIFSSEGDKISGIGFNFNAEYVPYEKLSKKQKELELQETDRNNTKDPILEHLPYSALDFSLEGIHEADHEGDYLLVIGVRIFLSNADSSNQQAAIEKIKKKAQNHINSLGFNFDDYVIRYQIIEPAL